MIDIKKIRKLTEEAYWHWKNKKIQEAHHFCQMVLKITERVPEIWNLLGLIASLQKEYDKAENFFDKAIELKYDYLVAKCNLAHVLQLKGDLKGAKDLYEMILTKEPLNNIALMGLAKIFFAEKDWLTTLGFAKQVLALDKKNIEALFFIGETFIKLKKFVIAKQYLEQAVKLENGDYKIFAELSLACFLAGELDKAEICLHNAIKLNPKESKLYNNLGVIFMERRLLKKAEPCYQKAIELDNDFAEAKMNLGVTKLVRGEWSAGFELYDWRLKRKEREHIWKWCVKKPLWDGSLFSGKRLLIVSEQGFGDVLQFSRYFEMVKERGGYVYFLTNKALKRIFEEFDCLDRIYVEQKEISLDSFDFYIPLMSLPKVFSTSPSTIPHKIPYLKPKKELLQFWHNRFPKDKLKIGLVWRGNAYATGRYFERFCKLEDFSVLAKLENTLFYSLQKGEEGEKEALLSADVNMPLINYMNDVNDFMDTAVIISHLDIVVTIDTSVLHLAAGMGKTVLALLPFMSDWRWFWDESKETPWYPNVRLYRQKKAGDWQEPVNNVLQDLKCFIKNKKMEH